MDLKLMSDQTSLLNFVRSYLFRFFFLFTFKLNKLNYTIINKVITNNMRIKLRMYHILTDMLLNYSYANIIVDLDIT